LLDLIALHRESLQFPQASYIAYFAYRIEIQVYASQVGQFGDGLDLWEVVEGEIEFSQVSEDVQAFERLNQVEAEI